MLRACLVVLIASASHADQTVTAGDLSLTLDKAGLPVSCATDLDPSLVSGLSFYLREAASTEALAFAASGLSLDTTSDVRAVGDGLEITLTLRNTGEAQLLLETGIDVGIADGAVSVFDGRSVEEAPEEPFGEDKFLGRLQLCAAWNDRASFGMGLAPTELRSWFHHVFTPSDRGGTLRTVTRLVLDPGKSDAVTFFLAARPGEFGFYEILDAYYDTYPTWFVADPDVDPRANLGGAEYRGWNSKSAFSSEICRRLYAGWDWCYAPFRRTGDIYGHADLWDYDPARKMSNDRAQPREDFHAWRAGQFAKGKRDDVAYMFYVPSQIWCEQTLANARYADALTEDPETKTFFSTPWVTGHDNELRVFPYKTSYGEQSLKDMRAVAEELDLPGFAFDTAGGEAKYRGSALPNLEGRAWDESGPYCQENIAVAHLKQFVHSLRDSRGYKLAVVSNPNPRCAYTTMLYADSAMMEGEPWKIDRDYGASLRWMAGQKTLVWWEGYGLENFIRAEDARPEQVRMLLRGLADFTLLQSLRLGYIPPANYTQGVTRLVEWLPTITECVTTGWQPVPAAHVPEPCWVTRYGEGLNSLFAVAHETADDVSGDVVIDDARLVEGALLLADHDGSERANAIRDGKTVVPVSIPTRTPIVLRALGQVTPASSITAATISQTTGFSERETRIHLTGSGRGTLRLNVPPNMEVASVTLDGRPLKPADPIRLKLTGEHDVVARFESPIFATPDSALLDFPFTGESAPSCAIHVADDAGETEQHLAERLSLYFRYWHADALNQKEPVIIPIQTGIPEDTPAVLIDLAPTEGKNVRVEDGVLHIAGESDAELRHAFFLTLRALDTKYFTALKCYYAGSGIIGESLTWDEAP